MIRTAISPRLATRTRVKGTAGLSSGGAAGRPHTEQGLAGLDYLGILRADLGDHAGNPRRNGIEHLHNLDEADRRTLADGAADGDEGGRGGVRLAVEQPLQGSLDDEGSGFGRVP